MPYVALNWNANPATDNVTAYDIWRGTGTSVAFGSCTRIGSIKGTSFTDTMVAYSTAYTYYIVADNAAGDSSPEGPLNITSSAPDGSYVQNAGGAPSVQEGTLSARPAAGTAGRLYVETDNKALDRDNGASWDTIGGGSGTVTTTGSPASGNLTRFSGATSITNGDLSGDVTTSGTLVATLSASGVTAGTYGDATHVPQITVDAKGRITGETSIAITQPTGANPTATASDVAVNGSAATFMRSDAAPAVQKTSASVFGLCKVDGTTITASAGVISSAGASGANPTATAGPVAVNGSAGTFMRSDAAPAVQKCSASQFGLCEPDGVTITSSGGVLSSVSGGTGGYPAGTPPTVVQFGSTVSGGASVTLGAAPTNGNLLVAMGFNPTSGATGAGWSLITSSSSGTDFGVVAVKVAGASESATQTPFGGSTTGCIAMWELNGQHASNYIVAAATQAESVAVVFNTPVLFPNVKNCIGLSAVGAVETGGGTTIVASYNGTQDVLTNGTTRGLAANHTNLGITPSAGIMVTLSTTMSSKSATILITS